MTKLEEAFIALWCCAMPITSFVLVPSIPGTIPAYLLALFSIIFVTARCLTGFFTNDVFGYLKTLGSALLLWTLLLAGSQFGHIVTNRHDFGDVSMIAPNDPAVLFRVELFTQSMYLFACVFIALYFCFFFRPHMMRYVYWGAYIMAAYGLYEWFFFLIFKEPGDFLGNRVYGVGSGSQHTGSWSQSIDFAGLHLLRIKSTFGEPSFFSAAVVPYLFLALDARKLVLAGLLAFDAFFSTSTSCYLTIAFCVVVRSFWVGKNIGPNVAVLILFGAGLYAMSLLYPDTFSQLFGDKFSGSTESGRTHQKSMDALLDLLAKLGPLNWIFGVGLGYVYAGVTWAVLVNLGLIGLSFYVFLFWKPILQLNNTDLLSLGLKTALFGIFFSYTLNVAEFYLPTTWMFIGLAYWKLGQQKAVHEVHLPRPSAVFAT